MEYDFVIIDVFSVEPFGGNQLAVIPDATGISADGMQRIAREFNFAETTFVLPAEQLGHTCRVRIFTPAAEMPFAGHPTIGTACALVHAGLPGAVEDRELILEEGVGPVRVIVRREAGVLSAALTLDGTPELAAHAPPPKDLAEVLSLAAAEVVRVVFASVGVRFCLVQLVSREAVDRARLDRAAWARVLAEAWSPNVFLFAGELTDGGQLYARMFAPMLGIEEDPATGSACAALVGAAASRSDIGDGTFRISILQGVAMGRRSEIMASATKLDREICSVVVSGATALVAHGKIEVPARYRSA